MSEDLGDIVQIPKELVPNKLRCSKGHTWLEYPLVTRPGGASTASSLVMGFLNDKGEAEQTPLLCMRCVAEFAMDQFGVVEKEQTDAQN